MEIWLLGSGGWMPTDERETTCIYVREGDEVLIVDAGTGLRRLGTDPALLEGVRRLSVVLTHFHLDHIMGLPFLVDFEQVPEREIWAAALATEGAPADELVHRLLDPPFLPDWGLPGEVRELTPPAAEIGAFGLEVRIQRLHPNPTLAVKVNGELAICTDTGFDEENIAFACGARILCHDAFFATTQGPTHTGADDAARIAAGAGVGRLVLMHLNPSVDEEELRRVSRPVFAATDVGRDGMVL
jgi:ribonuclease BN (tRNA processing enzyme)